MAAPVAQTGAGNVTTANTAAGSSLACNKPSNTADGDVLIAVCYARNSSTTWTTIPTGWSALSGASLTTNGTIGVFAKPIPSATVESATSYTWANSGGSQRIGIVIFRLTGAGSSPLDAVGTAVTSGTSSIVDPAVTAVSGTALLIAVNTSNITSATAATISAPSGMSEVGNVTMTTGTSTTYMEVAAQTLSASGSTGTRTAAVSPAASSVAGIMLTLAPGTVTSPPVMRTGTGNVTTVAPTSGALVRVAKPANVADGDVLVAGVYHRNTGPLPTTLPPGWTPFGVSYVANGVLAGYWKYIPTASNEPSWYTWRSPNGSARGAGIIARVTGCAPPTATHGPVDAIGTVVSSGTLSIVDPAVTVVAPAALLVAINCSTVGTTSTPIISAPTGMTETGAVATVTASASSHLEMAAEPIVAAGSTGTRTAAVSPAGTSVAGFMVALAPAGNGLGNSAQLLYSLSGGVTDTTAKVAVATKFCSGARVARSASADMSSPTYSSSITPDKDGCGSASFTGLTANTRYYYAVELDGALNTTDVGTFKTMPTPGASGTPSSPLIWSFAAFSCTDTDTDTTSFDDLRTRTGPTGQPALFLAHLGDMDYVNYGDLVAAEDDAFKLGLVVQAVGQSKQLACYRAMPLAYTWSDHDYSGANAAGAAVAGPSSQRVYRRAFPSHTLPAVDSAGIYHSFVVGRVRVIVTDGRSYMSPIANTDNSSKTKLGTAQKTWLKAELSQSELVKIWCHDDGWNNASTFVGDDTWSAYATERQELADYVTSNSVNVLYVHGDVHALSHDDGSHVPGRFPLISVSPMYQTPFIGNGTLSSSFYPNPASGITYYQQYGWFDVIDDGTQIVVRWYGISAGAVVLQAEMSWGRKRHRGWGAPA